MCQRKSVRFDAQINFICNLSASMYERTVAEAIIVFNFYCAIFSYGSMMALK